MLNWTFGVLAVLSAAVAAKEGSGYGWFRHEYSVAPAFRMSLGMVLPPPAPPPPCRQYLCLDRFGKSKGQGPFEFRVNPLVSRDDALWPTIGNADLKSGPFKANSSKSLKYVRPVQGSNGSFVATDNVQIKLGPTIRDLQLNVMNFASPQPVGFVGLWPGSAVEPSFAGLLYGKLSGEFVIFETKKSIGYPRYLYSGSLTLGLWHSNRCEDKWTVLPAVPTGDLLFTLETEKVEIGDFESKAQTRLAFSNDRIELDEVNYAAAIRELGVDADGNIDCRLKKEITIKAGELTWILERQDFIDLFRYSLEGNIFGFDGEFWTLDQKRDLHRPLLCSTLQRSALI